MCLFHADTPGKSGTPTIEDVDEDSVKLSWTPPKTDGGDKVRGYVIEAKEKGSNKWKPLNAKSPCKDTKFTGILSFFLLLDCNFISRLLFNLAHRLLQFVARSILCERFFSFM